MTAASCRDKVRFSLSDETGELRFTDFDIVDAPECRDVTIVLKHYLLGQPLADIDLDQVLRISCQGDERCMPDVAEAIAECQRMFAGIGRERGPQSSVRGSGGVACLAMDGG